MLNVIAHVWDYNILSVCLQWMAASSNGKYIMLTVCLMQVTQKNNEYTCKICTANP